MKDWDQLTAQGCLIQSIPGFRTYWLPKGVLSIKY